MDARTEKLVRWFMFSVLISLVPLAVTHFNLRLDGRIVHLEMLVARGELLLICTTLGAAALGELFPGGGGHAMGKMLGAGASMVVVVLSSFYYAIIQSRPSPDHGSILTISVWLFAAVLIAGASCLYFGHQEKT
ncbi:MAG TPA: hypothetical protein VEQ60_24330 [Longimicrobium sp.]|nr:hypothetical protein [Longimicrobium sp.]